MELNTDSYIHMIEEVEDYAILLLDEHGTIESWNKGAEKIKGYKPEEVIGKNFRLFYTKADQENGLPEKLVGEAAANGKATTEGWRVRKDGTMFWGNILITALHDSERNIIGFSKVTRRLAYKEHHGDLETADPEIICNCDFDQNNLLALINNTHDLMWSVDKNYKLITFNNAFDVLIKHMTGKSLSIGDNVLANGFTDEELTRYKKIYERAFSGETFKVTEYTPTPVEFWSELSFYPIRKGNEVVGTACYSHDITERKLSRERTERDEKRYRALVENGGDAIVILSAAGKPLYVSPSIERVLGYTEEEALKMDLFSIIHPDDIIEVQKVMERVIANPGVSIKGHTGRMLHIDGTWHWYESTVTNLLHDPAIGGIVDNFRDVTEKKTAEEKTRISELSLKQAQSIAHFGNWDLDFSTGIAAWSDEHCRIYGLSPEENKHSFESWISFIHPEDVDRVLKAVKEAEVSLMGACFENRIVWRDGTIRYISSYSQYELNRDGKPIGFHGVSHDITGQKEAEKKIIDANRLYAFVSAINQTIVHVNEEQQLYDEACRIAVDIGKFEFAWISIPDQPNKKLNIVAHNNAQPGELDLLRSLTYDADGPTADVLRTGRYYVTNDFDGEPDLSTGKKYAIRRGFKSFIILPIIKSGETIGTYNLFSLRNNSFDTQEIRLLEEISGDVSFALDVFEKERHRKLMEDKVIFSELRLKQAQAIAHFGSWVLNFSSGIAEWSDEACRIYGLSPEDNIQSYQSWVSFIHPEDLDYVMKMTKEARETLTSIAFHHRIVRRDGIVRHIYSQAHFEFDKEGQPVGLYGVDHDITETKEAEQALEQSEANLRLIMDLIPQSIFVKDGGGKYLFANKSFADLHGLTPNELINKSTRETIPVKSESDYFLKQDQEVISSGNTKIIPEETYTDHKGNKRIFYTIKVPYIQPGTNKKTVLGVTTDITEQKKTEKERTKMIADIVQRNKDLEQFSYMVSHNLRAPVANILGIVNIMQTIGVDKDDEAKVTGYLATASKNLDNVIRDINNILDLKHELHEAKETVKFGELLDEIKISVGNIIKDEKVQIISDFSAVSELITTKNYLYSIFYNLISNSVKYRRTGIMPVIEITTIQLKNKIQIAFKDNGLGIDLEKKGADLFGLYKRFHYHVEGKGLGLYMVKSQVEKLGGTILVESEVDNGTQFIIEFEINN